MSPSAKASWVNGPISVVDGLRQMIDAMGGVVREVKVTQVRRGGLCVGTKPRAKSYKTACRHALNRRFLAPCRDSPNSSLLVEHRSEKATKGKYLWSERYYKRTTVPADARNDPL